MEAPKMIVDCIHPSTENPRKLVKYAWLFHPTHCLRWYTHIEIKKKNSLKEKKKI